jgi:hypothetical protein
MYILKTQDKDYIVRGPEKAKHKGRCLVSYDRLNAMQFQTIDAAKEYAETIKTRQRNLGFKSYEITRAIACNV